MGVDQNKKITTTTTTKRKKMMIILIPYPAQGHVTPMIHLGQAFHTHGNFQPVLVTPESSMIHTELYKYQNDVILYKSVPDCITSQGMRNDFFSIEKMMEEEMPQHLDRIISELEDEDGEGNNVVCLVVDLLASWAIQVGIRRGIFVAGFWPAMVATNRLIGAIPEMVQSGFISQSGIPSKDDAMCFLHEQPPITTNDLPWIIGDINSTKARFKFWIRTINRSSILTYLFINSFTGESLESSHNDDRHNTIIKPLRSINPTILQIGALNIQTQVNTFTPSFLKEDIDILNWLETQNPSSVLYISFGTWVNPIEESKIKTLATALEETKQPFLWVLASAWRQSLPEGFINRNMKRGKVVLWAPQKEVLKHKSVGCYLTHCGWNSTMEAIQFQKRVLCYPVAGDQFINCKYIVDVWRVGIRMCDFEKEDLEEGVRMVMGNDEMSSRLVELKEMFMGENEVSRAIDSLRGFMKHMKM